MCVNGNVLCNVCISNVCSGRPFLNVDEPSPFRVRDASLVHFYQFLLQPPCGESGCKELNITSSLEKVGTNGILAELFLNV